MMNERGFTLVGVLISCVLLAAMTSVLFAQQMKIKQVLYLENHMVAANLAQAEIETIKGNPSLLGELQRNSQITESNCIFQVETIVTPQALLLNIVQVTVLVTWQEWGISHDVKVETLLRQVS